ncbi:hypothetical protein, partial [Stenotrophomonas sp. 3diitr2024]|uniref:hypothetical protein n=1 Tax=Stenotrophomonas sp. 3diitr2024 TaxID=3345115 RepID=UPI0035CC3829
MALAIRLRRPFVYGESNQQAGRDLADALAYLRDQQKAALEVAWGIAGQQLLDTAVQPARTLRAFAQRGQHA